MSPAGLLGPIFGQSEGVQDHRFCFAFSFKMHRLDGPWAHRLRLMNEISETSWDIKAVKCPRNEPLMRTREPVWYNWISEIVSMWKCIIDGHQWDWWRNLRNEPVRSLRLVNDEIQSSTICYYVGRCTYTPEYTGAYSIFGTSYFLSCYNAPGIAFVIL